MSEKWNFPGSRWLKFDFHTHTPKSFNDYGRGDESFKHIKPEEWLQKAMKAGLDCVVVTDHNSGEWINELKIANKEIEDRDSKPPWFRELTIFPGVEINVADSNRRVHLLAVFDPDCDSQKVTSVLGACGITEGFGDDENTATTTGFVETVEKITKAGGIAIPAHIDGSSGLLEGATSLKPELEKSLNKVFAAEFCYLNKFDQSEPSLKKAVDRLAKLGGSDAHRPDAIGRHSSWLKMSRPSIEGLQLALRDHEFCVKNQSEDPNDLPDIFLSKLTIKSMLHCGRILDQPFIMQLHPHFNSVIGGRGTGKSTILESVRIAARRENELKPFEKLDTELAKFLRDQRGPKKDRGVMSSDTEILLEIHRRGKNYQLRWRFNGQGSVLEEQIEKGWQDAETGEIRERFPISIYSQKQINELATNSKGLLEVVDRSPEVDRAEWEARWESVKSQFLQLRERQRELLRQVSGEQQIRAKLQDVENDLKQYEEKGHGEILKQYQKRSQQKNSLPTDHVFDELSAGIRKVAASAELSDFPSHLFDDKDETTAEIKSVHEQTAQALKDVGASLDALAETVIQLKQQRNKQIESSPWFASVQSSINAYDSLVKKYEEKKSQLSISLFGEWVQQRNQLQQQLQKLESVRKEADSTQKQITEKLQKLLGLQKERFEKRRDFLDKVIGDNDFVRMELVQFGDVSTLEDEYRSLLNLEDKFASSVCDRDGRQGILWEFFNWEKSEKTSSSNSGQGNLWEFSNCEKSGKISASDLPDLISNIKSKTLDIAKGQVFGNHGTFDKRLKKFLETQPASFDQLDAWWPEDMLRVKYSKDPSSGKFDDLEKGSAGQKASAILAFLLSHGSEPLVIDQPEDDLDNALIYDLIVTQIHENKNKRQLIIVTHNPNIVVNGDAELIHVLKFENGQVQIDHQGGLENADIRNAVCTIMEGGREAFDKRYKRITLEV